LTRKEAMAAKCKDCTCGYADGRGDCEIPGCPLYAWMPYRAEKPKRPISAAQKAALAKLHASHPERQKRAESTKSARLAAGEA
jgi:hypothetical protein